MSEVEHLPLVSDELFARAQERLRQNGHRTDGRRNGQAAHLFTGMVRRAPLVEGFFAQRIFGPMRLEKLERQLLAHQRSTRRQSDTAQQRLRESIADLDERIGRQIEALERGIEPDLIAKRISKLRKDKERAEAELRDPSCALAATAPRIGERRVLRAAAATPQAVDVHQSSLSSPPLWSS